MKDTIDETAHDVTRTEGNAVSGLAQAAADAGRLIPPVWPLATSVAVNPYLGHANETLAETGERLGRLAGIPVTMPREWYRERIADKHITDADLAAALAACVDEHRPADLDALKAAIAAPADPPDPLPTVADLAADVSGFDWPRLIDDRIGAWAAGHFDAGQALWAAPKRDRAWTAWREWATHDLTPEIHGLADFARFVRDAPAEPLAAMARAVDTLAITSAAQTSHFHHLLLSLGGWAQVARHRLWTAELEGATDTTLFDLIAIRLVWEEALFHAHRGDMAATWPRIVAAHAAPVTPSADRVVDTILQEAMERAAQRDLAATLRAAPLETANGAAEPADRPALQAAFCIDVRSEVFRRALEGVSTSIETLGFAGFFGVFTSHRSHASDVDEARLPVLLSPRVTSISSANTPAERERDLASRYAARATRAWGRFKLAAVSSFAFVEAMGPVYVWKLIRDGLGLAGRAAPNDPKPRFDPDLDATARITAAETVLRAMSLTAGFARVVLLAGHGANVVNNPHASALHCGACGGYSGEVNARLLAGLLNDRAVRTGLRDRGIDVPDDTLFIAALHDTTTDAVTLYDHDHPAPDHARDIDTIRGWLAEAGARARTERAMRLPHAHGPEEIAARARDWSQVRPEWALAGCKAFIAAPRARTRGRDLEGRAFLHDYDWRQDAANDFAVLELIMTAPVVVASWISLQYYGSATAPEAYGGGNKLLHNVVGGIGVLEGNGGSLRAGLPWQSVHDGERLVHEPLRLTVMIEAPVDAMTRILDAHPDVRALFDNRWLHLMALDAAGRIVARYDRDLRWHETAQSMDALSA